MPSPREAHSRRGTHMLHTDLCGSLACADRRILAISDLAQRFGPLQSIIVPPPSDRAAQIAARDG